MEPEIFERCIEGIQSKGRDMSTTQASSPLHGITLEMILTRLVEHYGWEKLGEKITVNCFTKDPSIKSSLKFLRKTPWARKKLESLYLHTRLRKEILQQPVSPLPQQ